MSSCARILMLLLLSGCKPGVGVPIYASWTPDGTCPATSLEVEILDEGFERSRIIPVEGKGFPHRFTLELLSTAPEQVSMRLSYKARDGTLLARGIAKVPLSKEAGRCFLARVPSVGSEAPAELAPCPSEAPRSSPLLDAGLCWAPDAGGDLGLEDSGPDAALEAGIDLGLDAGLDLGTADAGEDGGLAKDMGLLCGAPIEEGRWQLPIEITTGAYEVPLKYSVSLTFDHRALVEEERSLPSGADIEVMDDSGDLLDRVVELDPQHTWNQEETRIWFQLTDELRASSTVRRYWLLHGTSSAQTIRDDPQNVFMSHIDMEAGSNSYLIHNTCMPPCDHGLVVPGFGAHTGLRAFWLDLAAPGRIRVDLSGIDTLPGYYASLYLYLSAFTPGPELSPGDRALTLLRFRNAEPVWQVDMDLTASGALGLSMGEMSLAPGPTTPLGALPLGGWQHIELWVHPQSGTVRAALNEQVMEMGLMLPGQDALITDIHAGVEESMNSLAALYLDDIMVRPWIEPEPSLSLVCPGP